MKKALAFLLAFVCVLTFISCGSDDAEDVSSEISGGAETSDTAETSDVPESSEESEEKEISDNTETSDEAGEKTITLGKLSMNLPEGFVATELEGVLAAVSSEYPDVTDNITFTQTEADDISKYTVENLTASLSPSYDEIGPIDLNETEISGIDSLLASYTLKFNGIDMSQLLVIIFDAENTYTVAVTIVSGNYNDVIEEALDTIAIN